MPVRIIRFKKRPPGAEQVLAEIAAKLREMTPIMHGALTELVDELERPVVPHCYGCGKLGIFLCANCEELQSATERRCAQLYTTLEGRFARVSLGRILAP